MEVTGNSAELQQMQGSTLESMIHFIYTSNLRIDWARLNLQDILRAADMFNFPFWPVLLEVLLSLIWTNPFNFFFFFKKNLE